MQEFLDIVDKSDRVVGRDTRENVHASYQIHRGIHVFVVNSKKEILLQKRSMKKDYYPGYYDASVGAQVLSGESYKEAALRETEEELGFVPRELSKVCDYDSFSERQREKRRLFVCVFEGEFKIDEEEVESVEWCAVEKIKRMIEKGMDFTEGFKISFERYLEFILRT